jgi:hypothetical protein
MAGVVLRRDRLFQRIAQRHSPPKAVQQGRRIHHRALSLFGLFSFCGVLANEC